MILRRRVILNRIRFLRLKSGMKQEDLARKILVSQSSLSGYENGKFEPDSKTLRKIADIFHVSVDYLLGGIDLSPGEKDIVKIPVYSNESDGSQGSVLFYFSELNLFHFSPDQTDSFFGLYMDTDAMEPRICSGDLVIARRQPGVPDGSIAVVQAGSGWLMVKRVWNKKDGSIVLLSSNEKYEPTVFTKQEVESLPVRILGLVVKIHGYITPVR